MYNGILMNRDEIRQLSEKVVAGIASDQEIQQYNELCNYYNQTGEGWDENLHGSKNELQSSIRKAIWTRTGLDRPSMKVRWLKWVIAASFILTVSVVSLLIAKKRQAPQQVAQNKPSKSRVQTDISPGQNGAVLTLGSGQTILIDSAVNGSLVQQGDVSVIKKNGELVYHQEGNISSIVMNTMTTPKGRQFNLVLADGSRVWLNAASSITFPTAFAGNERRVAITGEAYFDVVHNASKPFIVEKGTTSIKVLGTHFNVNAYDDEKVMNVTLLEGSVQVSTPKRTQKIAPRQQARINKDETMSLLTDVDLENVVAWKNGRISFQGADIGTVMRQMSRWYDVDIEYDNKLEDLFYADMARSTMLSDVLKALELTRNVHFKIEGRKVTVVP
jgi:hypothetical protein